MAVTPARLDGIAADCLPSDEIKAAIAKVLPRLHNSAGDIRFALAGGTGALPSQGLKRKI